jgi:intracellular proteinase inhibitor BsuPI
MSHGELSTDLTLDRDIYAASDTLTARLTIRNSDPGTPGFLSFSSGQIYDLEIRDGQGNVVLLWSRGKVFPQVISELEIQDQKEYLISVPLVKLPRGKYVVQGWFTSAGPPRAYSASARFHIQ